MPLHPQPLFVAAATFEDESGYTLARVPYGIVLSPQALEDLNGLTGYEKSEVRRRLEVHLRHDPKKTSRSRIKKLRGLARPQFRLRVGDIRVFYDVEGRTVQVLTIVTKQKAEEWLRTSGVFE